MSEEQVIALNLGGFDYAVTALLPDGNSIQIPYGDKDSLRDFLVFLVKLGLPVIVENPLVVAVELDEEGAPIGPPIQERLLLAQAFREALIELGADVIEVEGDPSKYTRCPFCGEEVSVAEKYILYKETKEDYEQFLKEKEQHIERFLGSLEELEEDVSAPIVDLMFIPLIIFVTKDAYEKLKCSVTSSEYATMISAQISQLLLEDLEDYENNRIIVVNWLYTPRDVLDEKKMNELIESSLRVSEESAEGVGLMAPVVALYSSSGIIEELPEPRYREICEGYCEVRLFFLPVVVVWGGKIRDLWSKCYSVGVDDLNELRDLLSKAFKLEVEPVVHPPVLSQDVGDFLAEYAKLMEEIARESDYELREWEEES